MAQDGGEAPEGLPQRHGHSVLQLRTTHLHHVGELAGLSLQRLDALDEVRAQLEVRGIEAEVDGRGVSVVGRLRAVDVVIGREVLELSLGMPHQLEGTVADDLIGVHIGRRARPALDHVDGELIVVLALEELVAGGDDGVLLLVA